MKLLLKDFQNDSVVDLVQRLRRAARDAKDGELQSVAGATPPTVFTRWMKVVTVSLPPPVGPAWVPFFSTRSQGMAFSLTNARSKEKSFTRPQTVLVSLECCQAARMKPFSSGLGPKK